MFRKSIFIFTLIISPLFVNSQVNMDFEAWGPSLTSDLEPLGWGSLNADAFIFSFSHPLVTSTILETSNPGQGVSSVKLVTKSGYNSSYFGNVFGKDTMGGMITLGMTPYLGVPLGFPYTQSPSSVDLMYKCNISAGDTGVFLVQVTHWNGTQRIIDGDALMLYTGNINTWTSVTLPLSYYTTNTPDTLVIIASSSATHWLDNIGGPSPEPIPGSELEIDAINLNSTGSCPPPDANFSYMAIGQSLAFFDSSSSTGLTTYNWDFGDGIGTSFLPSPIYLYTNPGNYNVCLTVTDSCGTDSTCQNITVSSFGCPPPIALFSYVPIGLIVSFSDQSTSTGSTSYNWDFGDGIGTSNLQNPIYSYSADGIYTACLTVSDSCDTSFFCLPVTVFDSISSSNNINHKKYYSIYPNPANENINIILSNSINSGNVIIYNNLGAIIKLQKFNGSNIKINSSKIPNGLYSFIITENEKILNTGLFIIQHK